MISPGNSCSSQGLFLCFSFCSGSVLCKLSEISFSVMASVRFIRCSLSIKLAAFCSLSTGELCAFSLSICISFFQDGSRPILFLLSEGNSGQLGLSYPVVLRADILQFWPCFHSWEWLIIQPLVLSSLTDFSPWDPKEVYYPHQGNLGLFDIMTLSYSFHILSSSDIMASTFKASPPQSVIGNSNNNTFTLSTCLSMVILFYD
jgi:hypothetical protein